MDINEQVRANRLAFLQRLARELGVGWSVIANGVEYDRVEHADTKAMVTADGFYRREPYTRTMIASAAPERVRLTLPWEIRTEMKRIRDFAMRDDEIPVEKILDTVAQAKVAIDRIKGNAAAANRNMESAINELTIIADDQKARGAKVEWHTDASATVERNGRKYWITAAKDGGVTLTVVVDRATARKHMEVK